MYTKTLAALSLAAQGALAFPWVVSQAGVNSELLRRQQPGTGAGSAANCPFNPVHKGAVPFNAKYPYNNATGGKPGNGNGGYQVPAPGDVDHYFVAPDYKNDIRGPCPGLNTAANHGFLSRDGITTFTELVDAQQNLYNVGYDLAVLLAVLGLTTTDGDIATERLSIGCDATTRTSVSPAITGSQPGLDGHDKFEYARAFLALVSTIFLPTIEADTSLTRNDFFTHGGDNFNFNGTLFGMMTKTTGGLYNRENLALYRYQRYQQSLVENPYFYFGPFSLLLFGASSFLYELMPSGTRNYTPDIYTISSFFGAVQNSDGTWSFNGKEKIPDNWTNRVSPYTIPKVGAEIFAQYALYPVQFGGNTGNSQFNLVSGPAGIFNGGFNATSPESVGCLLYQLATERIPSSLNSIITPTVEALGFALNKLQPGFENLGCPAPLT